MRHDILRTAAVAAICLSGNWTSSINAQTAPTENAYPPCVWPISNSATPDAINHTFGPRQYKLSSRYEFGRGIDINVPLETPVHAACDGRVRIAGQNPSYPQPLVQLQHDRPVGKPFYTNYMYLSEASVREGDEVKQGQVIGKSGKSPNGYERLRFELRDGGTTSSFAVHPLAALPYSNTAAPTLEIQSVIPGRQHSKVELLVAASSTEVDIVRVELEVTIGTGEPQRIVYDMNEWNRRFKRAQGQTTDPMGADTIEGIKFTPDPFQIGIDEYKLYLTYLELPPAANAAAIRVSARAVDAGGKSSETRRPK